MFKLMLITGIYRSDHSCDMTVSDLAWEMAQALLHMEDDPTAGFRKLNFLLSNPPFPPETFGNLLLLHCNYGYHELAADILAENR